MTEIEKAYIADFLDADGCVNAKIVQRAEYRLKFQIESVLPFFKAQNDIGFCCNCMKN